MSKYAGKWAREAEGRPLYSQWHNIKCRCRGWSAKDNPNYYERGIDYIRRWESYDKFEEDVLPLYEAALKKYGKKVDLCIDRINVNKGYSKSNVRFVSRFESNTNGRQDLRFIEYKGHKLPMAWWARIYGIDANKLKTRLDTRGWPLEKALNTK